MERYILTFVFTAYTLGQNVDPCTSFRSLNDSSLLLTNTSAGCPRAIGNMNWYRFEGSKEGILATSCPTGNQCGTSMQGWMSGNLPSYFDGIQPVDICIRQSVCCDRKRQIQVKNCNTYVVYQLIPLPPCASYCFNQSSSVLQPVSTTQKQTYTSKFTSSTKPTQSVSQINNTSTFKSTASVSFNSTSSSTYSSAGKSSTEQTTRRSSKGSYVVKTTDLPLKLTVSSILKKTTSVGQDCNGGLCKTNDKDDNFHIVELVIGIGAGISACVCFALLYRVVHMYLQKRNQRKVVMVCSGEQGENSASGLSV